MKFKIYLAGAMAGLDKELYNSWRIEFIDLLTKRYKGQYQCLDIINPVDFYDPNTPEHNYDNQKEPMEYDLWHVRTSDLIVAKIDEYKSIGTAMELMLAKELNKPVIGYTDMCDRTLIHPWYLECCNKCFEKLQFAVDYIDRYYLTI